MASWVLSDVEREIYVEEQSLSAADLGRFAAGCAIRKRRLQAGLSQGVDIVEVDNGAIQLVLLPTRGMGIWKAWHQGLEIGWQSPVKGPVHPAFVTIWEPSGIGWLSGFDELLVRCGLESNGAPDWNEGRLVRPLHGKIANLPAWRVEVTADETTGELRVEGVVDEARLYHNKLRLRSTLITRPGQPGWRVVDLVSNLSAEPGQLQLLYHINIGPPLAAPGSKVLVPHRTLAPRNPRAAEGLDHWDTYEPGQPHFAEQAYFFEPAADAEGRTAALLQSADRTRGLRVAFNTVELPLFVLWKSSQREPDGYVTGLEPALNFPNPTSFEQQHGRVRRLEPGAAVKFELEFELYTGRDQVAAAERAVARLQEGVEPEVFDSPRADWSA